MIFQMPRVTPIFFNRRHRKAVEREQSRVAAYLHNKVSDLRVTARQVYVEGESYQVRDIDKELQTMDADASWRQLTWRERARYDLLVHARRCLQQKMSDKRGRRS